MERFWSKVNKGGPTIRPELGPCWVWTGAKYQDGYGQFRLNGRRRGAHRFSWEMEHGHPPAQWVLHKCDNPPCVNPAHLFEGDHTDNQRDMIAKGRRVAVRFPGESHPQVKLSNEQVRIIRASSNGCRRLSICFGVSKSLIRGIRNGSFWKALA